MVLSGCQIRRKQPWWGYCHKFKWGRFSSCLLYKFCVKGENAMKKIVQKFVGSKGLYYLLMIAALGLALGASVKWHP